MHITFADRLSDSPFIERVWRSHSESGGMFTSLAMNRWMMVVENLEGVLKLYVHGPETQASTAYCPPDGEWLGIQFTFGTYMPHLPTQNIINRGVLLPEASSHAFWLRGSAWEFPTYANADTFVSRLARLGYLVREPVVASVLHGQPNDLSLRSAQRHFRRATGLSHNDARLIERARYATRLLQAGTPILDVVYTAGYFDQAHLTRACKRFIGQTPMQIMQRSQQLSFQYNTPPWPSAIMPNVVTA